MKNLATKNNIVNCIFTRQTVHVAQENRFKGEFNFNFGYFAIQLVRVLQSGKIQSQYQKRCSMVLGLLSEKKHSSQSLIPIFFNNAFVSVVLWNILNGKLLDLQAHVHKEGIL